MKMKACQVVHSFLRLTLVLCVWLLVLPFITFWTWKLAFTKSFSEAQTLFLGHISRCSTTAVLTDCLCGVLISVSIKILFLGAISLRKLGGHNAERDRNAPRAQHNMNLAGDGIGGAGATGPIEARMEHVFERLDAADGAEGVPFDEFVGMRGPLFHIVANACDVLASNITVLSALIFLPFLFGRLVILYLLIFSSASGPLSSAAEPYTETTLTESSVVAAETLPELTILAVGCIFILSLVMFYLAVVAVIRYKKWESLVRGRFSGIVSIAEKVPFLLGQFLAAFPQMMPMIQIAFHMVIAIGVYPLMCGWWLNVCTRIMFGKTTTHIDKEIFLSCFLSSSMTWWFVGIKYMQQISIFFSILKEILRNEVLYFLPDGNDIHFNPFLDLNSPVIMHALRFILCVAFNGSLIVMLVFLPAKLAMRIFPSYFPLRLTSSDLLTILPANMLIFQICILFASKNFKLRSILKFFWHYWFRTVGWTLGLTDFLLPRPNDNGDQENVNRNIGRQDRPPIMQLGVQYQAQADFRAADIGVLATEGLNFEEEYDGDEQPYSEYKFVLRIVFLLVVAWMTLLVFNSAMLVVPISIGRAILYAIHALPHDIKSNDIYTFVLGIYAIWIPLAGAIYSIQQIRARRTMILASQTLKWFIIVIKISALLSIWIFVIPILIGILAVLLVCHPIMVPIDEIPVFHLYREWTSGIAILHLWVNYVMEDPLMPFVDERWRINFETVRQDGFSRLRSIWVLREILFPITIKLLIALCLPYILARIVFPVLGYSLLVNAAVYRFAWCGCLCFSVLYCIAKSVLTWLTNLRNSIHDDRYRIGRMLQNFDDNR